MNIRSNDVASLEAALLRYATANDIDLREMRGSIARIALCLHGSEDAKEQVRKFNASNLCDFSTKANIPEKAPRAVLRTAHSHLPRAKDGPGCAAETAPTSEAFPTSEDDELEKRKPWSDLWPSGC